MTPELLKDIEEEQAKLREKFASRAKPTAAQVNLRYAIEYEKMAHEFFAAVEAGYQPSDQERNFNARRLAQALQAQGRYEEALSALITGPASVDDEEVTRLTQEILAEVKAIDTPDDEHCACHVASKFPTTFVAKHVRVNGELVSLVRCSNCGHLNATKNLPEDLAQLEQVRAGKKQSDKNRKR